MDDDISTTIIGAFDDINSAQMTVDELKMAGYDVDEVHLIEGEPETRGESETVNQATARAEVRGFMTRLLLGMDLAPELEEVAGVNAAWWPDEETHRYFEDLRANGRHIVVVASADDLSEAHAILKRNGADIEGHAGGWLTGLLRRWRSVPLATGHRRSAHPTEAPSSTRAGAEAT